jgi:hypothetical protein
MSANAYCDDDYIITERSEKMGFNIDTIFRLNDYDTNGYIAHDSRRTVTVLRGSHSKQNWIDDFDLRLIDYNLCEACEVHEGFYNYAMTSLDIVNKTLSQYPNHKHVFTGHSLGSSAIFIANELRYTYGLSTYVYTFGSPKLGNIDFALFTNDLQERRTYRYTHYQDIVPHIPSSFRFEHHGVEFYENEYGNITNKCNDDNCSEQFNIYETNPDDHMWYLGQYMSCYVPFELGCIME